MFKTKQWVVAALVALVTAVGVPLALLAAPTSTVGADSSISAPLITSTKGSTPFTAGFSWTKVSGAGGYNVYQNGQYIDTTSNPYYHKSTNGSVDTFYVTAFDTSKQNFSGKSNQVTIDTNAPKRLPPAPGYRGFFTLNGDHGTYGNVLWNNADPAYRVKGVNIYRNGSYLTTVEYPQNNFQDQRYKAGDTYYLVAFNDDGFSGRSSTFG